MSRRIYKGPTENLGTSNKRNRRSTKEYETIIWQEKKKLSRNESGWPCVVGEQKYPIELTFEEFG